MTTSSSELRLPEGGQIGDTQPGGPPAEVLDRAFRAVDQTLVYDAAAGRREAIPPRLLLLLQGGPRAAAEYPVVREHTTIGRGAANAVVLRDPSVSRRHAAVQRQDSTWMLVDLGSGNGTRLNGRAVVRVPLRTGDEIGVGDSVLQFIVPGGVLVRGQLRHPGRHLSARAAVAIGAMAVLLGIAAALFRRGQGPARGLEPLARRHFESGVALVHQGRWLEARDRLRLAAELSGRDEEIARARALAEVEAPRAEAVEAAKAALARNDFSAARAAIAEVPDSSALTEAAREVEARLPPLGGTQAAVRPAPARTGAQRSLAARPGAVVAKAELAPTDEVADEALPALARHARTALAGDPRSEAARRQLREVEDRARDLYLRAYVVRDEDPEAARRDLRVAADSLPAGDETAAKARRWLERLEVASAGKGD